VRLILDHQFFFGIIHSSRELQTVNPLHPNRKPPSKNALFDNIGKINGLSVSYLRNVYSDGVKFSSLAGAGM
jgi:hypothetical protein